MIVCFPPAMVTCIKAVMGQADKFNQNRGFAKEVQGREGEKISGCMQRNSIGLAIEITLPGER